MTGKDFPILVIGIGSIGERYIRNLWNLGYKNLHVFRVRRKPYRNLGDAVVTEHNNWNEIVDLKPFISIITSPTHLHLSQAIDCARIGAHLLVEKPLSFSDAGLNELEKIVTEKGIFLQVAYMMRYHPLIIKMKEIINEGKYGDLLYFSSKWGEYLPDWHPWENYKESYAARTDMGGGAALTLSHDIDLANWFCNSAVTEFKNLKNYRNKLGIDAEAGSDIIIRYDNGVVSNIHLNYFEKVPERYIRLIFDEASVVFDYYQNKLIVKTPESTNETVIEDFDRNDMFIDEIRDFFNMLKSYKVEDSLQNVKSAATIIKICTS